MGEILRQYRFGDFGYLLNRLFKLDKVKLILELLQEKLKNVYTIILLNKIDLPDSQKIKLVVDKIELY